MTQATFTKPKNRLSWRVGVTGVMRAEAVGRAKEKLEKVRPAVMKSLDESLAQLNALMSVNGDSAPPMADLYRHSDNIAAISGVFGLDALGKVAFSLCELISEFESAEYSNVEYIRVHLDAMRVIRQFSSSIYKDENHKILSEINLLLKHFRLKEVVRSQNGNGSVAADGSCSL